MLNKLSASLRGLLQPGDCVVCAVSGGADSVALLFGLYLLREKLGFSLEAAHFNHHLRGEESDADEAFVRELCCRYQIPLHLGGEQVQPGSKGLEAAARDARYRFLRGLPGKIATAHTADDNAETLLMHLLRGTGLKGLGAIAPVNGPVIRPMLDITRQEVESFLAEYSLPHREDSSNHTDDFLRNRIRREIMPLFRRENPSFSLSVSAMAQRLRLDEELLQQQLQPQMPTVSHLRQMPPALRSRYLERFLKECGIPEPEQSHLEAAQKLVFSNRPSARADFPGGKVIARNYDSLELRRSDPPPGEAILAVPGVTELPDWGIRVTCQEADSGQGLLPVGRLVVRSRRAGDSIRLPGGTKTLKKWMIDQKISAANRDYLPIIADDLGVIWVPGIGLHPDRRSPSPAISLQVETLQTNEEE